MRQSIPVYTSYTENSVWPHFESILPGVPPPTQPPKNTTTTHADAPHYQSPPLIREIRKVGDVFTATFTLSPFPPIIISNIDLSLYSSDPLRKWFHISLNLLPTMSKEGFSSLSLIQVVEYECSSSEHSPHFRSLSSSTGRNFSTCGWSVQCTVALIPRVNMNICLCTRNTPATITARTYIE